MYGWRYYAPLGAAALSLFSSCDGFKGKREEIELLVKDDYFMELFPRASTVPFRNVQRLLRTSFVGQSPPTNLLSSSYLDKYCLSMGTRASCGLTSSTNPVFLKEALTSLTFKEKIQKSPLIKGMYDNVRKEVEDLVESLKEADTKYKALFTVLEQLHFSSYQDHIRDSVRTLVKTQ
jgi:hypothetical protein